VFERVAIDTSAGPAAGAYLGGYLQTLQSLLDYSLTQLYREAERHRLPPGHQ